MDYIDSWTRDVVTRPSMRLRSAVEVEGMQDAHLGPRWEFAKVRFRAEPSDHFDFRVELGADRARLEKEGYLLSAIFGLLDVLFVSSQSPLRDVRVTLIAVDDHEIDSTPNAFRMAGRAAGAKLLDVAMEQMTQT